MGRATVVNGKSNCCAPFVLHVSDALCWSARLLRIFIVTEDAGQQRNSQPSFTSSSKETYRIPIFLQKTREVADQRNGDLNI